MFKKGHFSRVCHQRSDKTLSAVFVSAILSSCSNTNDALRSISVLLGEQFVPFPQMVNVIPDTGAEVTVAGDALLGSLGIKKSTLNHNHINLKHVAGGNIDVVGSCFFPSVCTTILGLKRYISLLE